MWPNVEPGSGKNVPDKEAPAFKLLGFANCAVLKALKNSARKSRPKRSVSRVCFITTMSKLRWSGPRTAPTPIFPNAVPPSVVMTGGLVMQLMFRKLSIRSVTEPGVASCALVHPAANCGLSCIGKSIPKAFVTFW